MKSPYLSHCYVLSYFVVHKGIQDGFRRCSIKGGQCHAHTRSNITFFFNWTLSCSLILFKSYTPFGWHEYIFLLYVVMVVSGYIYLLFDRVSCLQHLESSSSEKRGVLHTGSFICVTWRISIRMAAVYRSPCWISACLAPGKR